MKLKVILFYVCCFAQLNLSAQAIFDIGAIVETESHLWTLTKVSRYTDSLTMDWAIMSKKPKMKAIINTEDISLTNYYSSTKHKPLHLLSTTKFEHVDALDTDTFRIVFPAIEDSTSLISIHLSEEIMVDSIILPSSDLLEVRYKIPFCDKILKNRKDSLLFSDSLFSSGMKMYKERKYHDAMICFEKCYAFDKQLDHYTILFSWLSYDYYDYSRIWLSCCYYKLGWKNKAESLDGDYMLEPFDRKLVEKSDSIHNLLHSLSYKPYSKDAHLSQYKKICELDSISLGANHQRYALSLYDLGQAYSSYRLFNEAKLVLHRSYNIITGLSIDNHLAKSILNELARIAYQEEDYLSAIRYLEQSLGIKDDDFKFSEENMFSVILSNGYSTLANYYLKAGNWEKALFILKNKLLYWKTHDQNNYNYTSSFREYASLLSKAGRKKEALRVYSQIERPDLSTLGVYYFDLGDYQNALRYYQEAQKDSSSLSSLLGYNYLNSLAICYQAMGDTEKAILTQKKCIKKTNPDMLTYNNIYNGFASYTTELSNLASFFNLNEQYDSALVYERKSLELKEKYCSHSENIAYSYMNIGRAYGGKGEWEKAVNYLLFSYDIYKKQRQSQRELYHLILSYLSKYSFSLCNIVNLSRYISEYMMSASEDLLSTFQELTYNERSRYIDKYSDMLNRQIPMYAYYTHSDSIIEAAYNASLMIKGALLNSENSVKRVIEESKDASLKNLWEEMRADRYILSKVLEKDSLYRKLNADSLQKVIYSLEDSLVIKCKKYDDITNSMRLKWQDIQNLLSPKDIAIEFMRIPVNNDSIIYVALSLRKDSESPKMTRLFEERQLKLVSDTIYYQCKEMTDIVWSPLLSELNGIENIYFSPSGALYNIGIEYLSGMEDYNIYRLSSTREIVTGKKSNTNNLAVLYGGLDYDAKLDTLSRSISLTRFSEKFVEHTDVRSMKYRGGQEKLTHTLDEVEQIGKELSNTQWKCLLDTMSLGTEESFKLLSGKRINTLHIATHGFYYTPEEADNIGYDFLLPNNQTATEDKSLSRSGLLMSGANHILNGDSIPENVEDGILTAKEIADVDLRGLDLVVLSACQTGLGDISQGEGVFGLQRGFKKAGANSILMSLWEVNDEATQILMTQFYKNLVSGQSKRQSLRSAQRYLREYDSGQYDKPEYWAAFIILDAIH